jgi:hypothetical protein
LGRQGPAEPYLFFNTRGFATFAVQFFICILVLSGKILLGGLHGSGLFSFCAIPGIASVVADYQDPNASIALAKKKIVWELPQISSLVTTHALVEMLWVICGL